MEAVTLGAAKNALNSVVETSATAITDEIGLLLGVQEELFFIKEELEIMQAFLRAASTENVKSEVVTTWIKQVQRLAFDVEDCLQEASVHLMKKSCLPIMCSVKKRDHIARKIRVLKTRIEDVSKRNLRYNLINKDNGGHTYDESATTRSIANVEALLVGLDKPKNELVEIILKEHESELVEIILKEHEIEVVENILKEQKGELVENILKEHGELSDEDGELILKEQKGGLVENILKEQKGALVENIPKEQNGELVENIPKKQGELRDEDGELGGKPWNGIVISVVGMGGLGKTTLAREVYGCQELRAKFECFAWLTVLHPFKTDKFIESLAKQILFDAQEDLFKKTIKEKVRGYLKGKKYFIVIDDLSSVSEWDKIKDVLPTVSGSRIIVTTRLRPLAETISHSSENIYEIKELSENDAFDLFCKAVYKTPNYRLVSDEEPITEEMKTQASSIIKSCGRLPLAIVTIGSYLATKPKTSAEWKTMHDHLSSELANNPNLGVVNTVFTCSYDGMPYHLKSCLLYLSVFHNHKEIRRSRIIRQWIADDVIKGDKKTAEEVGKGYFYDLMGRSLIQPSQMSTIVVGDLQRCNIQDVMYELILVKALEENTVSVLEDDNIMTMTDKVRHLVIVGGPCTGEKVLERVKLSHIRSVSIFGDVGDYLRYSRMKLVRVLDLEGTFDLNNRDLRSIGKLCHLKYLGLRGTKITKLPYSLGNLSELETLDIRNTIVFRLPTGLTKLHKLSYLRAGFEHHKNPDIYLTGIADHTNDKFLTIFCRSFGVKAPPGIGKLRSLNILGMINIGKSKGVTEEMQNLINLSKLAVMGITMENGKTLAKVIDGLKHLRSLVLQSAGDSGLRYCLESVSSPPKYLHSLKLYGRLGKLPAWISSLENLEKMHFRNTLLMEGIKAIEKLPHLKTLYMLEDSVTDLKELCFGKGTFPMLQVMILQGVFELESVSIKNTALKRLEQLKISCCRSIGQDGVSGLNFLLQLKEMEVVLSPFGESNKLFVSNLQEKLPMNPTKPILRVFN